MAKKIVQEKVVEHKQKESIKHISEEKERFKQELRAMKIQLSKEPSSYPNGHTLEAAANAEAMSSQFSLAGACCASALTRDAKLGALIEKLNHTNLHNRSHVHALLFLYRRLSVDRQALVPLRVGTFAGFWL